MTEPLTSRSERVEDLPLLLAPRDRLGVQPLRDQHCATHGHWVGLSLGWVTVRWLTHLLSAADQRRHHVEPWAEQRLQTLRGSTGPGVPPRDLRDDRLAAGREAVSDDARWQACAGAWTQHLWRVYDLQPERVRRDTTTARGDWSVTEDGLFQFGQSQDPRPDLPQVKVRLSVREPLGLPVATDVVSGQRADAPLASPAITRVRERMGRRGGLYVGDCQMGALEPRASIRAGGDGYLGPLAEIQLPPAVLEGSVTPLAPRQQPLTRITRLTAPGKRPPRADDDERLARLRAEVAGNSLAWTERRLVVRSRQRARAGETARRARLAQARAAVTALNDRGRGTRRVTERPALPAAVETILRRYRVLGRLAVPDTERVWQRPRRRYGSRPATVQVERALGVKAVIDRPAVATAIGQLGWRGSATNVPAEPRSRAQAVLASRRQYLGASDRGRLNGHPLSLTPMYLARDDQAPGLIRVVSVGVRVLTGLELVVRQRLAAARTVLTGLDAGNPTRATARPTTERLRKRVEGLTLTSIRAGRRRRSQLTPLSRGHRRILTRLNFPVDISTRRCPDWHKPP